ncbi:MAG: hypothetical protein J6J00_08535 [Treponema sp.]|nr:hypothetical protein [Treponema sp.]
MYLVKTNHFEILFPKESAETARFFIENADEIYEKAKEKSNYNHDLSMPIIISPDSELLNVSYTNHPYNRIVVFDSASYLDNSLRLHSLESLFYREIFRALASSVRSPLNHIIYKTVGGDGFQPLSLMYLPFSFVEGYSAMAEDAYSHEKNVQECKDSYYRQLLIQAKMENKFPNWLQAFAVRDIHPGEDLCYAAASGFAAYLMQSRGVEKYAEFWNECGKLHLVLANGIFFKVYGASIESVWKEFRESVPLPSDMEEMLALEKKSHELIEHDAQGLFEHVFYTRYGLVWYDGIRHEVDIYDLNGSLKLRQLLFIAENLEEMSLSPDGRYISVSFTREKLREEFKEVVTRVYDLKEREFLDKKYALQNAGFVLDAQGRLCLAGISVENKFPLLQVYFLAPEEDDDENEKGKLIYERAFSNSEFPHFINPGKNGYITYILEKDGGQFLVSQVFNQLDEVTPAREKVWKLTDKEDRSIQLLSFRFEQSFLGPIYSFNYIPDDEGSLARAGYITLSDEFEVEELFTLDCNINGGVYYPVFAAKRFYYSARKFSHNELRYLHFASLPFARGSLTSVAEHEELPLFETSEYSSETSALNLMDTFDFSTYNPFKYLLHVSVMPMLAIREISLDNGAFLWPSVGLTLSSDSDPMRNTEFMLSGGTDFLVLELERQINATPEEERAMLQNEIDKLKRYTIGGYIKNSSTPVDIEGGALLNLSATGEYDFETLAKTSWNIPVGTIIRDMDFSISSIYTISTDYYDSNKSDVYPTLAGWTPFDQAYRLFELDAIVKYSNSHQYGISKYERRGLTFGGRLYAMWDVNEMELLNSYRELTKAQIESGENTELTEAQLEAIYTQKALDISQVNIGLFGTVEIPRLNPLAIHGGWVLSLPATLSVDIMNETGTALEVNPEILLIGNEIQNGIPFLYLFFSRVGLKAGYDFCLNYDTTKVLLPDIRRENYLYDIFMETYVKDSLYLLLNSAFVIPTGNLSKIQFNMNARAEYFLRTNGFKFSFDIKANF